MGEKKNTFSGYNFFHSRGCTCGGSRYARTSSLRNETFMEFFNAVHRYFREFHSNKAKRRPLCYLPFFISRFAIGLAFFIPGNSRSKPKRHSATTKRKHAIILPRVVAKRVHFEQKGCPSLHQIPNKSFLTTIFTTFLVFTAERFILGPHLLSCFRVLFWASIFITCIVFLGHLLSLEVPNLSAHSLFIKPSKQLKKEKVFTIPGN